MPNRMQPTRGPIGLALRLHREFWTCTPAGPVRFRPGAPPKAFAVTPQSGQAVPALQSNKQRKHRHCRRREALAEVQLLGAALVF